MSWLNPLWWTDKMISGFDNAIDAALGGSSQPERREVFRDKQSRCECCHCKEQRKTAQRGEQT